MNNSYIDEIYDVAIIGGGPAGATLAARLKRETSLSIAIFEADRFPREHIGESLVPSVISALQESGALQRVLASDCWVRKAGGYYSWDAVRPWATFFEHKAFEQDGHRRWAFHVNRAEFDDVVLQHAKACGVAVFEEAPVEALKRHDGYTEIDLGAKGTTRCRLLVNASGRYSISSITGPREFLSTYRNIAIWNYIRGGRLAQTLPGEWNIFREPNVSPIGSFAFEDGWFWYIPIPMTVNGKREVVHSLGLVTDPRALKDKRDYKSSSVFMETARRVPFLGELVQEAELISDDFRTATNYSRISSWMCSWSHREIRIGDAAFFVDPLFSSGVHFAMHHAAAAAVLVKAAFDASFDDATRADLWRDYDQMLRKQGQGFALAIDQWYNEIAHAHPNSVYWRERGARPTFEFRSATFHHLVNGTLDDDLLQVISKGTNDVEALRESGAWRQTMAVVERMRPTDETVVRLDHRVVARRSITLEHPFVEVAGDRQDPRPRAFAHGPYWDAPDEHAHEVAPRFGAPSPCVRFSLEGNDDDVRILGARSATQLVDRLRQPRRYGDLKAELSPSELLLVDQLLVAGMMEIVATPAQHGVEAGANA
ncbi:NAD(P)/FAD-dependent oxidoreductase [Sorangium sp. So ce204]|uniref:NAD(P)/FAD-dependent oxidoreductase n=1 Tax=Sorangium sp. So ce204 TaxID=3133288 RepID=UPI003F5FB3DC